MDKLKTRYILIRHEVTKAETESSYSDFLVQRVQIMGIFKSKETANAYLKNKHKNKDVEYYIDEIVVEE